MTRTLTIALVATSLTACSPQHAALVSGTYALSEGSSGSTLVLDVEAGTAVVEDALAGTQSFTLDLWAEDQWLEGCPTQGGSQLMEVAALVEPPVIFETNTLASPILVAQCMSDYDLNPARIILTEPGELDLGACPAGATCLDLVIQ